MVTIKYYDDPTKPEFHQSECKDIITYLGDNYIFKDQLIDLRFFHSELLGEEIDTSELSFLDISEGIITVTKDSMIPRGEALWVYIAISAAFAAVTILLTPDVPKPNDRDQSSSTNALGASSNDPRINERIDDIFGTVTKHTPPLWQVPYRIGVDNQETEVLLLCVGRGKYQINQNEIYDGDTRLVDIENAQFSKYEPNAYPGNGSPSLQIGSSITEEIGIYRQSNDLNPSELLPPNDLPNSNIEWRLTGVTSTIGILDATSIPDGFDFEEYYSVNDELTLTDLYYFEFDQQINLWADDEISFVYNKHFEGVDLGENGSLVYIVTAVTENQLSVTIPASATTEVKNSWAAMTGYNVPLFVYYMSDTLNGVYYLPSESPVEVWYADQQNTIPLTKVRTDYVLQVGSTTLGELGPFSIPDDADEIILNFVSGSGFYKLKNNNEIAMDSEIEVIIAEVDIAGVPTGNETPFIIEYSSNASVRNSVFKTERIGLPYTHRTVSSKRLTRRDKSTGVSNVDIVKWRDLYSFETVGVQDFGDVTLAHVVIPSNSQSQLIKERRQNMTVTRLITEYQGSGVFGDEEAYATDDFAQILTHAALDQRIGRLTIDNINADGFLALSTEIENYFGSSQMVRFGYDFDDSNITFQDTFIKICEVVGCLPYVQSGVYDAFFEKLQPTSSMQITIRNKLPDSESREQIFEKKYDGIELSYRDENSSISETIYLPTDRSALNPERKELPGCTTELQAFRHASRIFNKQKYHYTNVTFDVDEFGRNIIPGKRIDSPDSTRFTLRDGVTDGYKAYEGEVIETTALNVELSEPVTFTQGEDHYIIFTKANGDNSESILCTKVDEFNILLESLPAEAIYDGYEKDRTKFTFMSEQLRESVALVPQTIEFSLDDSGMETNTITCVNYHADYYKDDLETP